MSRCFLRALVFMSALSLGGPSGSGKSVEAPSLPRMPREPSSWPTAADLARLKSVEGKPRAVVLRVLGPPSKIERRPRGEEVWDYPWLAACRVWIRDGVCTGTFYTAGY